MFWNLLIIMETVLNAQITTLLLYIHCREVPMTVVLLFCHWEMWHLKVDWPLSSKGNQSLQEREPIAPGTRTIRPTDENHSPHEREPFAPGTRTSRPRNENHSLQGREPVAPRTGTIRNGERAPALTYFSVFPLSTTVNILLKSVPWAKPKLLSLNIWSHLAHGLTHHKEALHYK